jgi:hypothetical protein
MPSPRLSRSSEVRPSVWLRMALLWAVTAPKDFVLAQNPCAMEILVFDSLTPCTQDLTSALGTALLVADGQCRTVQTNTDPSDPYYTLFPGNYRAECVNSTVVRIQESGCISDQCNSTSLVSDASCDRNNSIAASLYSRVSVPEFVTFPSRDGSYRCTQAEGSNVSVSFVIFGDCSSPTCFVTNAPVSTPMTLSPATLSPITPAPTTPVNPAPILVTPPSFDGTTHPTAFPNDNPAPTPEASRATDAPIRAPTSGGVVTPPTAPTAPTNSDPTPTTAVIDKSSSGGGISTGVVAGIGASAACLALLVALVLVHRRRNPGPKTAKEVTGDHDHHDDDGSDHVVSRATTGKSPEEEERGTTNEIWIDPNADEVSTLGGGTLQPLGFGMGQDEPTASVNLDFDFHRNQYRTGDVEDRTQSQQTTASTAFTTLSKLGLRGAPEFADDISFEEQFAELDDDAERTMAVDPIAQRVKPFEVRAPPGKLGMVVDTPNGGVPVVRAIKPDSVLSGHVQMGDRLISVDHINVTSMSALEVSNLISLKQNQSRLLIFCRLNPPVS